MSKKCIWCNKYGIYYDPFSQTFKCEKCGKEFTKTDKIFNKRDLVKFWLGWL